MSKYLKPQFSIAKPQCIFHSIYSDTSIFSIVKLCESSVCSMVKLPFFHVALRRCLCLRMLNQSSGEFGHPTFTNGPGRLPVLQLQRRRGQGGGDDYPVLEGLGVSIFPIYSMGCMGSQGARVSQLSNIGEDLSGGWRLLDSVG